MKRQTFLGSEETRKRISQAISGLAKIVGVTLGPGGRPVLIEGDRSVSSTKDGVTVARAYVGEGDVERVVVDAAREICERTVREVGDGTTTAIILGAALVEAGQRYLDKNPGVSPQLLARELKTIYEQEIRPAVLSMARSIRDLPAEEAKSVIRHVALVSANHDQEIAQVVADAVDRVGEDGMITAEEGAGHETRVVPSEGFSFSTGLANLGGGASSSFVNRTEYGDCVVEMPYVCLYDGEINDPTSIAPLLERVASEVDESGLRVRYPVLIFAHRFSDQVLKMFAQNFRKGVLSVVPVITPRNGQSNGPSHFLHDLAAYAGGTVFDPQGTTLAEAHIPQLGVVEKAKIDRNEGILYGTPDTDLIERRIQDLKRQMETTTEFDREQLRYRVSRLTGGVATIFAGGVTQLEARERRDRVVDAVSAVRSAMDLGVVPGGGATLWHVSTVLSIEGPRRIFSEALRRPFLQILENSGVSKADQYSGWSGSEFMVYDVLTRGFVEWWAGGIMDPAKVTLKALENALSVAQLLMTCGGVVANKVDPESERIQQMQDGMLKAIEGEALT